MVERERPQNFSPEEALPTPSAFDTVASGAATEVIAFLRLAEREGAYARLSEKRRKTLEMRYADGLTMPQIANILEISKQAVSQSLKLSPESLFKQMTKDVIARRTPISFREILSAYSGYRIYLDKNKKRRE